MKEPKYKVGDKVWYLNENSQLLEEHTIKSIRIIMYYNEMYYKDIPTIEYNIGDMIEPHWVYESEIFTTKQEAIGKIKNTIKNEKSIIKEYEKILDDIDLYFDKEDK